jgi:hypothetical protein
MKSSKKIPNPPGSPPQSPPEGLYENRNSTSQPKNGLKWSSAPALIYTSMGSPQVHLKTLYDQKHKDNKWIMVVVTGDFQFLFHDQAHPNCPFSPSESRFQLPLKPKRGDGLALPSPLFDEIKGSLFLWSASQSSWLSRLSPQPGLPLRIWP